MTDQNPEAQPVPTTVLSRSEPVVSAPPSVSAAEPVKQRRSRRFLRAAGWVTKIAAVATFITGMGADGFAPSVKTGMDAYDAAASDPKPTGCSVVNIMLSTAGMAIQSAGDYYDLGRFNDANSVVRGVGDVLATGRAALALLPDILTIPGGTVMGRYLPPDRPKQTADINVYRHPFNCDR